MKTITKEFEVYTYNELSESAKDFAFENWQETQYQFGYEVYEFRDFIKILSSDYGVTLKTWSIDSYSSATVQDSQFSSGHCYSDLVGVSALKRAMRLYDDVTLRPIVYTKKYGKRPYSLGENHHTSKFQKKRDMCKVDGTYLSDIFCNQLKVAIDRKNLNLTFLDYLQEAIDKVMSSQSAEYDYFGSREHFEDGEATLCEYLVSGEIFTE